MDVRVTDRYELRGDVLQWQVFVLKEVTNKETGETREDWVGTGHWYADIEHALLYILERYPRAKSAEATQLNAALEDLHELKDDIRRSARRFEKGLAK